jgi:hypothetical protein
VEAGGKKGKRRCTEVRDKKDSYDLWLQRKKQETSEKYKWKRKDTSVIIAKCKREAIRR